MYVCIIWNILCLIKIYYLIGKREFLKPPRRAAVLSECINFVNNIDLHNSVSGSWAVMKRTGHEEIRDKLNRFFYVHDRSLGYFNSTKWGLPHIHTHIIYVIIIFSAFFAAPPLLRFEYSLVNHSVSALCAYGNASNAHYWFRNRGH